MAPPNVNTPSESQPPVLSELLQAVADAVDLSAPEDIVVRELVESVGRLLPGRALVLLSARGDSGRLVGAEVSTDWSGSGPQVLQLTAEEAERAGVVDGAFHPVQEAPQLAADTDRSTRRAFCLGTLTGLVALEWAAEAPIADENEVLLAPLAAAVAAGLWAHRRQQEIRRQQDLALLVMSQTDALMLVVDADARIVLFNRALERLTGYVEAEVRQEELQTWLGGGEGEALRKVIIDALSGRPTSGFVVQLPLKTGGQAMALFSTAALYDEHRVIAGVAAVGLAQRHLSELTSRHEARVTRLGEVASGIADKLRSPLATLQERVGILQRLADLPAEAAEAAGEIGLVGETLDRLAQDLRALAGDQRQSLTSLSINQLVEATLEEAQESLAEHRARIRTALAGELPNLLGMRGRLHSALSNLIQNACRALGEEGGRITVRTWDNRDGTIGLSIADQGRGIPEDVMPHVFKPFYAADQDSATTGLGLSVVQDTIDIHDGTIDIDSVEGEGTVVTITLPVRLVSK